MNEDKPASEQLDLTAGMTFDIAPEDIQEFAGALEQAEAFDTEDADTSRLAEYIAALKELSDAVEDARKDVFEDELDTRVGVDDSVGPLVKRQGSRRYVTDDDATIRAIEDAGGNPREAMTVKASDAADVLDDLGLDTEEFIGVNEYEYFRRQS